MARAQRRLTSPLGLAVLAMLRDAPLHPYEIARLLKFRGKDQSIKIRFGSLYTVVRRLEESGWIEPAHTGRAGNRPERTVYRLTAAGEGELRDRMRELIARPEKEYPLFEAALSLVGALPPGEVETLLTERLGRIEAELAAQSALLTDLVHRQRLPRIFLIESEYALAIRQAEADYCRTLLKELADGSLDGVREWRRWYETGEFPAEWREREWAQADERIRKEAEAPGPDTET